MTSSSIEAAAAPSPLMTSRRFAPLFWTQFLAAFNDNFLKNLLVFLVVFSMSAEEAAPIVALASAIFIAPFFLLSALGGQIADRYDMARVAQWLKLGEVAAAGLAVGGLALDSLSMLMASLFLFGAGSALFSPVKYAILPTHLARSDLPRANAWLEAGTFVAILAGTIFAGLAVSAGGNTAFLAALIVGLSLLCWWISRAIPSTGSAAPDLRIDRNIFRSTVRLLGDWRKDRRLRRTGLMVGWFWMVGAFMLTLLPIAVKDMMGGTEAVVTVYLAVFTVAVGLGSAFVAWLAAGRIILLPAPLGTLMIAGFALDLALTLGSIAAPLNDPTLAAFFRQPEAIRVALDLAGMAVGAALLSVPSFAALQAWAPEGKRSRVIAAVNALSALFIAVGGGGVALTQVSSVTPAMAIGGFAVINAVAAVLMLVLLPTRALRDLLVMIFRLFYRVEVTGLENLQKAGDNPILAMNHVSFLDAPLALTLTEQAPVFAVDYRFAQKWWMAPFLKLARALPLDPSKPIATRTLVKAVKGGAPLVIFPEGRLTVTGSLMKVYDGAAMVADKTGAKVVPVHLDGLEQSPFTRMKPWQVRRRLFPKIKVTILEPVTLEIDESLKGKARRAAAGAALYRIMSELVFKVAPAERTILEAVIETAKERGMDQIAVEDPVAGSLTHGRLLTGAAVLARLFETRFAEEETLGVMLPNATGAAATLLGVLSAGKVPAMINFTAGPTNVLAACKAAKVATVLTSRAFVEQARLEGLIEQIAGQVRIVYLDDLRQDIGLADKLRGRLARSKPHVRRAASDPAVILFTSGSEGTPKGVVLTHRNILANAAQAAARIDFSVNDKVFNVLPVFHSFGLTAGLILPLISGVPVYLYPSPLHYRLVPELVYGSNATILFGTDTFLAGYARTAHPYDFRSLRYCFAGAEPVKASTRATYMETFGLRILEGYGVTEASPVIAINTPMFNRAGTVGTLMPGMEARLEPVPGVAEGGRLHLRGPNIMAGYLRAENPGVLEPPQDGWHDTGDIVTLDDEGFITIRGRAKRFAKIGGEMISLAAVETLAGELWSGQPSAVASVADPRKGERLVLVTEAEGATRADFVGHAKAQGASELMIPAEVIVAPVPLLGSGKVDFTAVTRFVEARHVEAAA